MTNNIHYSRELESAVLGACLLEKTALGRTYGIITTQSFYFDDNQAVYQTLLEMFDQGLPIDLITVFMRMTETKIRLNTEISHYLSKLTTSVVSSANIEYHCYLLNEMWKKRELTKLTLSGTDNTLNAKEQAELINQKLTELASGTVRKDWTSMDELMIELLDHQKEIASGKKKFITTGFKTLDKENGGFGPGQMIVLGSRPSVGKSAIMDKMARAIAMQKLTVGVISLEMNNTEIAARLASLDTDIDFWKIHRNLFDDESQQQRFYDVINNQTAHLPIFISDKTSVDISEIRAKAAKLKYKHGLDVLMIDYLQLVDGNSVKNQIREQEVAKISRGIKLLAMEMQIPIIVLCQLNRNSTTRKGKDRYPQLSDLRESGSLEQDADVVLMLHRDWMAGITENANGFSTEHEADLLAVKWRNGAMCHVELEFEPKKMKFKEKPGFIPIAPPSHYEPNEIEEPF